jgi:hypothetical protein
MHEHSLYSLDSLESSALHESSFQHSTYAKAQQSNVPGALQNGFNRLLCRLDNFI